MTVGSPAYGPSVIEESGRLVLTWWQAVNIASMIIITGLSSTRSSTILST